MLKIRLSRVGRKHEPVYRLVLTDRRNAAKSGKSLEVLGSYDSRRGEKAEFDGEKIKYWISQGAQVSPTVHNILVNKGILTTAKVNVLPKSIIEGRNKKVEEPLVPIVAEDVPAEEVAPEPETPAAPEEPVEEKKDEVVAPTSEAVGEPTQSVGL